jgi:hypothetical protein
MPSYASNDTPHVAARLSYTTHATTNACTDTSTQPFTNVSPNHKTTNNHNAHASAHYKVTNSRTHTTDV